MATHDPVTEDLLDQARQRARRLIETLRSHERSLASYPPDRLAGLPKCLENLGQAVRCADRLAANLDRPQGGSGGAPEHGTEL